jgi:hypothetical protein
VWEDRDEDVVDSYKTLEGHRSDILAMSAYAPRQLLATGKLCPTLAAGSPAPASNACLCGCHVVPSVLAQATARYLNPVPKLYC